MLAATIVAMVLLWFAARGTEGPHQSDIADHIGKIATHVRGLPGKTLMQVAPMGREPTDCDSQPTHHDQQHGRQIPIDGSEHENAAEHCGTRRNGGPGSRAFDGPRRKNRYRDPARNSQYPLA